MEDHAQNYLITAGPTREYIDDIRYISNPSSGRFGIEIARSCASEAAVDLVLGPTHLSPPENLSVTRVTTAHEMYHEVEKRFSTCDVLIMNAAVCDIRPRSTSKGKRPKDTFSDSLEIERTTDILAEMGSQKTNQYILGFCVNSRNPLEKAKQKLHQKKLDAIVVNPAKSLGSTQSTISVLTENGIAEEWGPAPKQELADMITRWISREAFS